MSRGEVYQVIRLSTTACASQPTPSPTSIPTSTATSLPSPDAHFPQMEILTGGVAYLVKGELALENGCFNKANLVTGDSFLLIWNSNFAIRKEQSVVQVINAHTGEVLEALAILWKLAAVKLPPIFRGI
jgi:hypothetical protein